MSPASSQGLGDGYDIVSKLPTDCDQTKGLNAAQDMLTANPDVAAIYGACGPPIIGALEAIDTAGKTLVTVGFDAGPDEVTAILAGTETASVAQFPAKMGELGADTAFKAANGEDVRCQHRHRHRDRDQGQRGRLPVSARRGARLDALPGLPPFAHSGRRRSETPMTRISALDVIDVRFPTSRELDGSDAMNPEPDYSAAYLVRCAPMTSRYRDARCCSRPAAATRSPARRSTRWRRYLVGLDVAALVADIGAFARELVWDGQLRWLGPEKGVMHMAIGAVVNALWDLRCRDSKTARSGRCSCRLTPEEIVAQIDFTYIDDALTPAEALAILHEAARSKRERIDVLEHDGFPAYTTSAGWLGYDDAKVDRLARQAVSDGFTMIKLKVGADVRVRHAASPGRPRCRRERRPIVAVDANQRWGVGQAIEWMKRPRRVRARIGSRSPRHPTTCSGIRAIRRAVDPDPRSRPASTCRTGSSSSSCCRPRRSTSCRSTPAGSAE